MPGSKSYTNRALLMAALTKGAVTLQNPLYSDDTRAMIEVLRALGLEIETHPDQIIVHGDISSIKKKDYHLFAHDSGTTARFILALLCIVPGVKTLQGSKRLNERPMGDLVDALRALGAEIEYCEEVGKLPLRVISSSLSGDCVHLKGDVSSQFCSSLLLISPYMKKGLNLFIKNTLISKPYVDMTIGCMKEWGVTVEEGYFTHPHQRYQKKSYTIEGDFSSAGYFFAMAALTKSKLTLKNLNPYSLQADRKFVDILARMGNEFHFEENSITIEGKQVLAMDVDMRDCPDQAPTMAVLAAFAKGVTKISGVRSLRVKETERIKALKNELKKMGIQTEDTEDVLIIHGGSPVAAEIETYNDHRMAMSFAIAGMKIRHPEVVSKTFPAFWEVLESLQR